MNKRILSLFLAVLMVVSIFPAAVNALVTGDIDGSGKIESSDARLALRFSVGLEKLDDEKKKAADADFDGSVTAADARLILRASVGLENLVIGGFTEEGVMSVKPQYNPKPKPGSGSKAFRINPVKGLTISAPKDALDKDRTFKVRKLSDNENNSYAKLCMELSEFPLVSFDVNSGLEFPRKFPGEMTVEFNLDELGIEKEFRDNLNVVCISDDNKGEVINSEVKNGVLTCRLNHNSILQVCVAVTVLGGAILGANYMSHGIPNIKFNAVDIDFNKNISGAKYRVYYPASMSVSESAEYKKLNKEAADIHKKYYEKYVNASLSDMSPSNYGQCYMMTHETEASKNKGFLKALANDSRYKEIQEKMTDTKWLIDNYLPTAVKRTVKAIEYADEFLFERSSFHCPNFRIEIFMFDGDGGAFGHTNNLLTRRPFIKLYKNHKGFFNDTCLAITLAHELFHVVQKAEYCLNDDNADTSFWEATALLFEREAYKYYLKKGYVTRDDSTLTDRDDWGDFAYSLMNLKYWGEIPKHLIENFSQEEGYLASHFLEFLISRYGFDKKSNGPIKFIRDLLTEYDSIFTSDWADATAAVTSGDISQLSHDYLIFCMKNKDNFKKYYRQRTGGRVVDLPLGGKQFILNENFSEYPFCSEMLCVKTGEKYDDFVTVVLFNDGGNPDYYTDNILRIYDENGEPMKFIRGTGRFSMKNQHEFYLHEIHASSEVGKEAVVSVLLFTPQPAPEIKINHDDIEVYTPAAADKRLSKSVTFEYGGRKASYDITSGYKGISVEKNIIIKKLNLTDPGEIGNVKVSVRQVLLGNKDYDNIYGPSGQARLITPPEEKCQWTMTNILTPGKAPEDYSYGYDENKINVNYRFANGFSEIKYSGYGTVIWDCQVLLDSPPGTLPDEDAVLEVYKSVKESVKYGAPDNIMNIRDYKIYWSDSPDGVSGKGLILNTGDITTSKKTADGYYQTMNLYTYKFSPSYDGPCKKGTKRYLVFEHLGYITAFEYTYMN